eukprot:TRINITY_DN2693_c0_g1_i2.p1 TRINITY_DN2693_c0_g1~~TRINITY_DN2693_c0_g1_i2.p1  ORF type:complete len:225 (-),score=26.81 TRINITY_DN2693_c0_g1_i2:168-842(-)
MLKDISARWIQCQIILCFFTIRDVFHGKKSFYPDLVNMINTLDITFGKELNYMGLFGDNHDNERFLHESNNWDSLEGLLVFTLFFKGIPIVYYGDEQGFDGGMDPLCREPLWHDMKTNSPLYKSLKRAISVRKAYEIWNTGYRDIWHEKDLLVFGRGKVLVAVTNNPKGIDKEIIIWDKEKFPEETVLCDALEEWKKTCVKVKNRKIHLKMHEQKPRIFVPSDS